MNELKDKFGRLLETITRDRGEFTFFALFLPEDAQDRWDLVVSAPWATNDRNAAVQFLVEEIKQHLDPEDLISLSKIVVADANNPLVQAVTRSFAIEGPSPVEVRNSSFFGIPIHHAYIFAAKSPEIPVHT